MTDHIQKFLLVFILGLVFPTYAYACMSRTPVATSIEKHSIIFSGKMAGCFSEDEQNYIKFSLDRMWKGKGENQLTFATKECPVTFLKREARI
ncbi:MAG: hypothetical protein JKY51_09385 [Opitutaceae bacterium]|nr:hypothetical protein [Opitutaceae bacterium]